MKNYFYVSLKPKELEKSFRIDSVSRDKKLTKIIMSITLIVLILFIGLDLSLIQETAIHPLWIPSRIVASIASLIGIWLIQHQTNVQNLDRITLVWGLIIICQLLIINLTRVNDYVPVIVWDIITIFGIYFFVPVPHHYKILLAFLLTFSSGAIWCIYRIPLVDPYEATAILAAYVTTNIYGVFLSSRTNQIRRQLYVLLMTDSLTGVSNRRHFFDQIPRELERTRRYGAPMTLMLFDLDNLKVVNDKHGHDAGDELIRMFAKHCSAQLRSIDQFARFGGDEFISLLVETNQNNAKEVAERIRKSIEELKIQIGKEEIIFTTVSIGVATTLDGKVSVEKMIKDADEALYQAKSNGGNQIVIK